jgi:putative membrane protein
MITFGFTILKFFQYLQNTNPALTPSVGAKHLGIFLILLGLFCLIPGMIEHRKMLNMLHAVDKSTSRWSYALVVAILVGIIGLYALANALAVRL